MALAGTFKLEQKSNVNHIIDVKLIKFIVYYATLPPFGRAVFFRSSFLSQLECPGTPCWHTVVRISGVAVHSLRSFSSAIVSIRLSSFTTFPVIIIQFRVTYSYDCVGGSQPFPSSLDFKIRSSHSGFCWSFRFNVNVSIWANIALLTSG